MSYLRDQWRMAKELVDIFFLPVPGEKGYSDVRFYWRARIVVARAAVEEKIPKESNAFNKVCVLPRIP
jgi:hypothetical protein